MSVVPLHVPFLLLNRSVSFSSSSAQTTWLVSRSIVQNAAKSSFVFPRRVSMIFSICSMLLDSPLTIWASGRLIKPPAAFSSLSERPVFIDTLSFSLSLKETKASSFQGLRPELPSEKTNDARRHTGMHSWECGSHKLGSGYTQRAHPHSRLTCIIQRPLVHDLS